MRGVGAPSRAGPGTRVRRPARRPDAASPETLRRNPSSLVVWLGDNPKAENQAELATQHYQMLPSFLPVSVNKHSSGEKTHVGKSASKAPNQGLKSNFCCRTAGQGLAQKECRFHRHRWQSDYRGGDIHRHFMHVSRGMEH